jgi:protein SCO1
VAVLKATLVVVALALFAGWHFRGGHEHASLEATEQTLLLVPPGKPVEVPGVALEGRWSIVFFGFTSCPTVCPTTLQVLSRLRDDATQIVFVTTDPANDTPERMRSYLAAFDPRIVAATGSGAALARAAESVGAGSQVKPGGMDHSTSLFVIGPDARLAGIMLRPSDPARIASDLALVRASRASSAVAVR